MLYNLGMAGEEDNKEEGLMDMLRRQGEIPYRRGDRYAARFVDSIVELKHPKIGERFRTPEKIKEELEKDYQTVVGIGETNLLGVEDKVNRLMAPWPYNSRTEEFHFEGIRSEYETSISAGEIETDEQKSWVLRLASDIEQQEATERILFAMGGPIGGYFDVLGQLNALTSRERYHATADDYISVLSEDDPGLVSNDKDKENLTVNVGERKENLAKEGLRKEIIEKQDDFRLFSLGVAAVAQVDYEADPGKETFMRLSPSQVLFIQYVFGDDVGVEGHEKDPWQTYINKKNQPHKVPGRIEGWFHTSDSSESRRTYIARSIALLEKSAQVRKNKGRGLWDELADKQVQDKEVADLARDVRKSAEGILADYKNPLKSIHRKISERVINFWTEHDLAFMTSGRLGWGFEYSKQRRENGEEVVLREVEDPNIYKGWDNFNGRYWLRRRHAYHEGIKSASNFLSPDAQIIRRRFLIEKPGWAPPIDEYRRNDEVLDMVLRFLFDDSFRQTRKDFLAGDRATPELISKTNGDIDPVIKDKLLKHMYAWVTPFKGERRDKNGDLINLAFPMFFPPEIEIMDVWSYLQLEFDLSDKEGLPENIRERRRRIRSALGDIIQERPDDFKFKDKDGSWKTIDIKNNENLRKVRIRVSDLFAHGIKPSEIDYSKMNFETLDHYWVSMNMIFRFLKLMVDPNEGERDPSIQAFFNEASGQNERELAKRVILGFRIVPKDVAWLVVGLLPYMVTQQAANESGLFGPSISNTGDITGFVEKISKWIQAFKWLPQQMTEMEKDGEVLSGAFSEDKVGGKISNYGNDMALLTFGYMIQFLRIGQAAFGPNTLEEHQGTYDYLRKAVGGQTPLGNILKPHAGTKQPTLIIAEKQMKDAPLEKKMR
jgi:hypothetical protein